MTRHLNSSIESSASLSTLKIPTAKIFEPLLLPARYKAAYGGRGSGKSHFVSDELLGLGENRKSACRVCIGYVESRGVVLFCQAWF